MKIKTLYNGKDYGPTCLHIESRPVWEINNKVRKFIVKMVNIMAKENGVGIAAPQVGRNIQICAIIDHDEEKIKIIINPFIYFTSKGTNIDEEGCLSCPGRSVNIERHNEVGVEYTGIDDMVHREVFKGLTARIVQHELDHLNGKLIVDYERKENG